MWPAQALNDNFQLMTKATSQKKIRQLCGKVKVNDDVNDENSLFDCPSPYGIGIRVFFTNITFVTHAAAAASLSTFILMAAFEALRRPQGRVGKIVNYRAW